MPYVSLGDFRLYYEEHGQANPAAEASPVILLHGFTLDRRQWVAVPPALSKRFRLILMDARGHGLSDAPPTGYSRAHRVEDLARFVDFLNIDRLHLVGLSMGGSTALRYTLDHPSRLRSLTLVSTGAAGWNIGRKISRIDQLAREQGLEAAREKWIDFSLRYYDESRKHVRDSIETMMRDHSGAPWMDDLRSRYPDPGNDLEHVHAIQTPTLIIAGEEDRVFVPLAEKLHRLIPDSRLEIYKQTGHMVNMERPGRFNRDLAAFLNDVESTG